MAEETGLVDAVSAALIDTYKGVPFHAPGRVFTDLAVAIADGADAVSGVEVQERAGCGSGQTAPKYQDAGVQPAHPARSTRADPRDERVPLQQLNGSNPTEGTLESETGTNSVGSAWQDVQRVLNK
jgi:hypothetical protein